ncbi:hypothetical protein Y032_0002g701 [Ancylostoma ceylanicum]|uniref:Uncharacterized protein n=1 Tax=Ancylostoma ceylanicum TaxID=53326 RepID=A0A016W0V3_9BILA|nr:hypothetical protein Y032_0002g701 [Ancylostoma ceylanicum]
MWAEQDESFFYALLDEILAHSNCFRSLQKGTLHTIHSNNVSGKCSHPPSSLAEIVWIMFDSARKIMQGEMVCQKRRDVVEAGSSRHAIEIAGSSLQRLCLVL